MDGVTDAAFRYIAAKHGGPDVTFTEFVNVESAFFVPDVLVKDLTYTDSERFLDYCVTPRLAAGYPSNLISLEEFTNKLYRPLRFKPRG